MYYNDRINIHSPELELPHPARTQTSSVIGDASSSGTQAG